MELLDGIIHEIQHQQAFREEMGWFVSFCQVSPIYQIWKSKLSSRGVSKFKYYI